MLKAERQEACAEYSMNSLLKRDANHRHSWRLAFTPSTAFGPTETAPLSKRAKALMMLQSIISLIVVAVLVARAIGILKLPI